MYPEETVPYSKEEDAKIPVGTIIPAVLITGKHEGDRYDVKGAAHWADGHWTLVTSRDLVTEAANTTRTSCREGPLHVGRGVRSHADPPHASSPSGTHRHAGVTRRKTPSESRMSSFDLVINGKTVKANYGETLVDAGLSGWVAIPHDCCSGQCETCRVSVVSGQVDDSGTAEKGTVLACQAKVIGNAAIAFDHCPEVAKRAGLVTGISVLDVRHRRGDGPARHADRLPSRAISQREVRGLPGARSQPDRRVPMVPPDRANLCSTSAAIPAGSSRPRSAPRSNRATACRCAGRSATHSCARATVRSC
jgi:ferredoxin